MSEEEKRRFGTYDRTNYKVSRRESVGRWLFKNFGVVEEIGEPERDLEWRALDRQKKAFWMNKADHVVELMRRHTTTG